ncbi:MAG: hypothetical protein NTV72_01485 [Candidatus Taylorbacteria bacterium]|nr:hypothetical protein [Candidatus Taylorbacteria bacterium]
MKKKNIYQASVLVLFSVLLLIVFAGNISSFSSAGVYNQAVAIDAFSNTNNFTPLTYSVLNMSMDVKGKSLTNSGSADTTAELKQYDASNKVVEYWDVEYEQKGSSRSQCAPPVLNIKFDGGHGSGFHDKFHGLTTYPGYSSLKYKTVRLIPECDIWNDYNIPSGTVGFYGQLNVSLREYSIFKIFRAFDIPTMDVIGFANIQFNNTSEPGYAGQSFRYMMVQRDNEDKDEVSFAKQFNIDPVLYQSGDLERGLSTWKFDIVNRLTSAKIINKADDSVLQNITFDPNTTLRFLLLTEFLDLSDMSTLHNEDWGINKTTGNGEIIPHGFDASYSCSVSDPSNYWIPYMINQLPVSSRSAYQIAYYNIARNIFGDSSSLDKMITLINEFPYTDVDKSMLIDYIKIRFYQYAKYFDSEGFAISMGQSYSPLNIKLPFTSEEFDSHLNSFKNKCAPKVDVAYGVSATSSGQSVFEKEKNNPDLLNGSFAIDVKTGSSTLRVSKIGSFTINLMGSTTTNNNYLLHNVWPSYRIEPNLPDTIGPYYLIPPNTITHFVISFDVEYKYWDWHTQEYKNLEGDYYAELSSFTANNKTAPISLGLKTGILSFVSPTSTPPTLSKPSVIPSASSTNSGDIVKLTFKFPSDTIRASLYLACPVGVYLVSPVGEKGGGYACNKFMDVTFGSFATMAIFNTSTSTKIVVPNYYVYLSDNPKYALGATTQIAVKPVTISTSTPPSIATSTPVIPPIPKVKASSGGGGSVFTPAPTPTPTLPPSPSPTPSLTPTPIPTITPVSTPVESFSNSKNYISNVINATARLLFRNW